MMSARRSSVCSNDHESREAFCCISSALVATPPAFTALPGQKITPAAVSARVAECALQLEAEALRITDGLGDYAIVEAEVRRVHAIPEIVPPGTQHIDPRRWQPTIYSFRHYFGIGAEYGHRPTSDTAGAGA